jgi:hypothetical protein
MPSADPVEPGRDRHLRRRQAGEEVHGKLPVTSPAALNLGGGMVSGPLAHWSWLSS